ncbi:hypothetical protein QYE76_059957 [Lolium multiflorum]|uniref:NB-ARC domain-containing protein n=1 Tax=Lolium multiflorum TaxID=4521 RepID=A0AAD8W5Z7_LOLMU|nr:hypothetical protein QYE76_059957 [Lolium multiflorum]
MELHHQISGQFDCCVTAKMSRRPHKHHFLQHILHQITAAEQAATDQTGRVSSQNQNSNSHVIVAHPVRGKMMPPVPNLKPLHNDMSTKNAINPSTEQMEVVSNIKKSLKNKRYLIVIDDIWDTSELGLKSSPLRENTIMKAWELDDKDEKESNEDQPEGGIKEDHIEKRNEEDPGEKEINEDQAKKENNKDKRKEEINRGKSEKQSNDDHTKKISNEDQAKEESKKDEANKEFENNVYIGSKDDLTEKEIDEYRIEMDIKEDQANKISKKYRAEQKDHTKKEGPKNQVMKQSNEVQADERSKEDHATKGYKEYEDKKVILDYRTHDQNNEYHGQKKSNEDKGKQVSKEGQALERSKDNSKKGSKEDWAELESIVDQTDVAMNDDKAQLIESKEDDAEKGSQEDESEKESKENEDPAEKENEDRLLNFLDDWEFKSWTISEYKKKDWEIIKDAFPDDGCGSRIIVTTRISSIARFCCSSTSNGLVHEVKPLNDVDSERLFLTKAFGSENGYPAADDSRQARDEILRICEGIPMFITGMADLMKKKMQQSSTGCDLQQVPQLVKQFEKEMSYSYNDLFYGLELLPLCMSAALVHQKGCMIDKERLIRAWVREELIYSDHWGDCEEKAEHCFSELVDRNIIRLVTFPGMTEACHCQVDPFVLQFLVSKSAKVNFVTTSSQQASAGKKSRMNLSAHHPEMLENMNLSSTLSLTISGAAQGVLLDKVTLGSLVVLDLEGWNNLTDDDLLRVCDMGKLLPLKYLSVRNTSITKLPTQIQALLHLRELDIGGCTRICEIPLQVCRLEKLEALDLRNTRVRQLPEQIKCLQGLRRLLLDQLDGVPWTEMQQQVPEGIRHIAELRTLETVDLSRCSARFVAEALGGLTSLRVLSMTWSRHQCTDRAYRNALWHSIGSWKRLKSLTIHCRLGCSMEFLASLPSGETPPPEMLGKFEGIPLPEELEMFKVTAGRFPATPQWIWRLSRLAFLQITVCSLERSGMEILGNLPMLECLVLGLDYLPGEAAVIPGGGFRRLLTLSIDCRVPWLDFKHGAMPRLTHIDIRLSRVPGPAPASRESVPSGVGNLMSLEQVTVRYHAWYLNSDCVKATVAAMRKQVAELHYLVKLVINGIQDDVQAILEGEGESSSPAIKG